ncbi:unnamed protein product [Peniophora sp. CBMAI 1063]|nr:unnamed protein product [Peniophora sp. CBMAI 1063]
MPVASSSKPTTTARTRMAPATRRQATAATKVTLDKAADQLADALATSLAIKPQSRTTRTTTTATPTTTTTTTRKTARAPLLPTTFKQSAPPPPSAEPKRSAADAMRAANAASQALSALVQGGDKKGKGKGEDGAVLGARARKALGELRGMRPGSLDTERAAGSVVGKLIALELMTTALDIMKDMHSPLVNLITESAEPASTPTALNLLSLPLPTKPVDEVLASLCASFLLHALIVNANLPHDLMKLTHALASPNTTSLTTWICACPSIPTKYADGLLTRAYTALAKRTSDQSLDPCPALHLRQHALQCLLLTTPGTVEPATFWDQAVKFGVGFARATPALWLAGGGSTFEKEKEATRRVMDVYHVLYEGAQKREDARAFCAGKAFLNFCDYWLGYAKKSGDMTALDNVADIMRAVRISTSQSSTDPMLDTDERPASPTKVAAPASPTKSRSVSPSKRSRTSPTLQLAQLCAPLVQATALFEELDSFDGSDAELQTRATDALEAVRTLRSIDPGSGSGDDFDKMQSKARRALERLRRALVRCLSTSLAPARAKLVRAVLDEVVGALQDALTDESVAEDYTPLLDALFTLARTSSGPTPDSAYTYLSRAATVLHLSEPSPTAPHVYDAPVNLPPGLEKDAPAHANLVRCLAGAHHNIAGALYASSPPRPGHAARFMRGACVLGGVALRLYRESDGARGGEEGGEGEGEVWRQLEEQMSRRWELLGVCYAKIADRKMAHDAFARAITSHVFTPAHLSQIRTLGPSAFFAQPALSPLATLIDRTTYMSAIELCAPSAVSLSRLQNELRVNGADRACVLGALLERQLESLRSSMWKDAARRAAGTLFAELLDLYEPARKPIRRAGVLCRLREAAYYAPSSSSSSSSDNPLARLAAEDPLPLLRAPPSLDRELLHLRPLYAATSHLWAALLAHRDGKDDAGEEAAQHISEACRVLRDQGFSVSTNEESVKSPPKVAVRGKRAVRTGAPAAKVPKTPRKPSSRKAAPSSPKGKEKEAGKAGESGKERESPHGWRELFGLMRLCVELMGFMAHVVLKVQLLHAARVLAERCGGDDEYILASTELATEYLGLGRLQRAGRVFNAALDKFRAGKGSESTRVFFLLRHSQTLAVLGDLGQSETSYIDADRLAKDILEDEKDPSATARMRVRVQRIERTALAAGAIAEIRLAKDDPTAALDAHLQALRLYNRALATLSRFNAPTPAATEDDPFASPAKPGPGPGEEPKPPTNAPPTPLLPTPSFRGLEWRIARGLLHTLLTLSSLYTTRGSAREAQYFASQAETLALSLRAPSYTGAALARRGELALLTGRADEAGDVLVRAAGALGSLQGPELADVQRVYADLYARGSEEGEARRLYRDAAGMLEDLGALLLGVESGRRVSIVGGDMIRPGLFSALLRRHIWLLRHELGEEYQELLQKLSALPASEDMKAEERALIGKLTLHDAFEHFREDIFLSSITESVIALPMSVSSDKLATNSQETARLLSVADGLFMQNLSAMVRRGQVASVREAAIYLAYVRALQTSVGRETEDVPLIIANLLDASAALTLHREMLEIIQNKFQQTLADDLRWPTLSGDPPLIVPPKRASSPSPFSLESDPEDEPTTESSTAAYWKAVRQKYASASLTPAELSRARVDALPPHWTVVHIAVTEDRNTLFLSRQRAGQAPLVLCLPLRSDEEEHLAFGDALHELSEIVRLNDETTRAAATVRGQDREARAEWWAQRAALDTRLKELLENVEFCWLGAFKTVLGEPVDMPAEVLADFRARLDKVFKRALATQKKKQTRVQLDDSLLACIATLPAKSRDEELEDLVYYILDLYQFHGVQVAIAEVDVDQVVVDLRAALEEHAHKMRGRTKAVPDAHTFLVLDKNVQGIPWESIPTLRGHSVSRIPSVDFLLDRLDLVRWRRGDGPNTTTPVDRADIDVCNAFYVLNPSGDLTGTEKRFADWLRTMERAGWEGIVGKKPSEQQVVDALGRKDLFVYFGHGGAEQFVRSHKVRHLERCAAAMLWGCSSGLMRDMGDFDRTGTPYNYMLGGCPTLVANLWDVTDRDIDKFTQSVFDELHWTPESLKKTAKSKQTSVVAAVARSREVCKLKYLTGASPVVYGIPFYS